MRPCVAIDIYHTQRCVGTGIEIVCAMFAQTLNKQFNLQSQRFVKKSYHNFLLIKMINKAVKIHTNKKLRSCINKCKIINLNYLNKNVKYQKFLQLNIFY